ncbi:MAG TPA: imelysin family protein [Ideonella sp.]|uniref:imelysin family protein n=1 Tax=Ideonella sp. TaxID=1929293 RepID=UPI002E365B2A|nr:imelysin family protein [Ideonella sp.]HEX5686837.1 imelysin family protein [Ideonella sp.]
MLTSLVARAAFAGCCTAASAGVLAQAASAPAQAASGASAALPLAHPQTSVLVEGLLKAWYAPAARRFGGDGDALVDRAQAWCASGAQNPTPTTRDPALDAARQAWVQAMASWTRLSAVQIGPLLERHSDTRLDFQPMRPAALDKVIANPIANDGPQTDRDATGRPPRGTGSPGSGPSWAREWAMDRVGAQARGLPAMEYLLWKKPAAPRTPACAYLVVLARDLRDEARELALAYAGEAAATRSAEQAAAWFNTYVNQWLAGMGRMRWRDLEMPVRSWGMEQAPRAASGQTALAWRERWLALRVPTAGGAGAPDGLVSLTSYLRARGLAASADALARDTALADAALQGATPATPSAQLLDAAKRVDFVTHTIAREVSTQLQIQLEFSADDGD